MKKFRNVPVKGYDGKPIGGSETAEGVKLGVLLYALLNSAPLQTQNDSIQGMRLAKALDKARDAGGDIEIEEGTHDWLKVVAEKVTPQLFRVNGNMLYQYICEGYEKEKQPEGK